MKWSWQKHKFIEPEMNSTDFYFKPDQSCNSLARSQSQALDCSDLLNTFGLALPLAFEP